jgi:hypothetical protein
MLDGLDAQPSNTFGNPPQNNPADSISEFVQTQPNNQPFMLPGGPDSFCELKNFSTSQVYEPWITSPIIDSEIIFEQNANFDPDTYVCEIYYYEVNYVPEYANPINKVCIKGIFGAQVNKTGTPVNFYSNRLTLGGPSGVTTGTQYPMDYMQYYGCVTFFLDIYIHQYKNSIPIYWDNCCRLILPYPSQTQIMANLMLIAKLMGFNYSMPTVIGLGPSADLIMTGTYPTTQLGNQVLSSTFFVGPVKLSFSASNLPPPAKTATPYGTFVWVPALCYRGNTNDSFQPYVGENQYNRASFAFVLPQNVQAFRITAGGTFGIGVNQSYYQANFSSYCGTIDSKSLVGMQLYLSAIGCSSSTTYVAVGRDLSLDPNGGQVSSQNIFFYTGNYTSPDAWIVNFPQPNYYGNLTTFFVYFSFIDGGVFGGELIDQMPMYFQITNAAYQIQQGTQFYVPQFAGYIEKSPPIPKTILYFPKYLGLPQGIKVSKRKLNEITCLVRSLWDVRMPIVRGKILITLCFLDGARSADTVVKYGTK